jgi:hypothetical protein
MSNLWESAICNEYALKYAKYAKYVNKSTICRICTSHFADAKRLLRSRRWERGTYECHGVARGAAIGRPGRGRVYHEDRRRNDDPIIAQRLPSTSCMPRCRSRIGNGVGMWTRNRKERTGRAAATLERSSRFPCTTVTFFPESERTGPPVGDRPHSTGPDTPGARARRARAGVR